MTMLYQILCYNEVCYKETALYIIIIAYCMFPVQYVCLSA